MKLLSRAIFFSIPVYICRKKAKFGQTERKDEKNSSLHRILDPNLIVSVIFALHDPSGSHTTINGKSSEAYKETFLRNRSLEREFPRKILNITYFGNLYH